MGLNQPRFIVIHCSDSAWGDLAAIDSWHRERGFSAYARDGKIHYAGYHEIVLNGFRTYARLKDEQRIGREDGAVEHARFHDAEGAHCLGFNDRSLGICLIGVRDFTPAQLAALHSLVEEFRARYRIPRLNVIGHYETPLHGTKTCPNFDVAKFRACLSE